MGTCTLNNLSPSYCYKKLKCRCQVCRSWKQQHTAKDSEKAKERSRIWRLNNIEKSRQNSKDYQKNNPEKLLQFQLKKYGITVEDYNNLEKQQEYVCAICKNKCIYKDRLSVDHNHKTGKVRGLLCGNCNTGLGKFKENVDLLEKAQQYIQEHNH